MMVSKVGIMANSWRNAWTLLVYHLDTLLQEAPSITFLVKLSCQGMLEHIEHFELIALKPIHRESSETLR